MISEIIKNRRAVFPVQYNKTPILKEELEKLLDAANWAPTHRRTEPWRFKVFYSEESREKLSVFLSETYAKITEKPSEVKMRKIAEKPLQSGCVMAICMQRDLKESVPEWEEIAATSMAVQNMWLLSQELGIGMYWSTPSLKDQMHQHIDMDQGESCLGFLYLGKIDAPLEEGIRHSTFADKTVWF